MSCLKLKYDPLTRTPGRSLFRFVVFALFIHKAWQGLSVPKHLIVILELSHPKEMSNGWNVCSTWRKSGISEEIGFSALVFSSQTVDSRGHLPRLFRVKSLILFILHFILLPKRKKRSTTTAVQVTTLFRMAQRRGGDWLVLFTWHVFFFGSLILNAPGEFISTNFIHLKFWMVQYRFEYRKNSSYKPSKTIGWNKNENVIACRFHVKLEPHNFHSKFALLRRSK